MSKNRGALWYARGGGSTWSSGDVAVLDAGAPRSGEVWIESLGPTPPAAPNAIGWRLIDARGEPVSRRELDAAIDRLLCNPAIERAVVAVRESDRDISVATE